MVPRVLTQFNSFFKTTQQESFYRNQMSLNRVMQTALHHCLLGTTCVDGLKSQTVILPTIFKMQTKQKVKVTKMTLENFSLSFLVPHYTT